jgi:hypothetical protein
MNSQESRNKYRTSGIVTGSILCVLVLTMIGCTNTQTAQKAQPKGLTNSPSSPDSSRIVVIPNPYLDDVTLANGAKEEAEKELVKRGYKVVSTEAEADLVAVPTVETSSAVSLITAVKPVDLVDAPPPGDAQVDRTGSVTNSLGSLGSLSVRSSGSGSRSSSGKPILVIEAFRKDAWDKALIVNELQLMPVWRFDISLPAALKPSIEGARVARRGDTDFVLPR